MADRSVSVPSDLESFDVRGQIYQLDLLNNARTVSSRTSKFGRITHMGRGVFLGGHFQGQYTKYQNINQRSKVNLQGRGIL